jgi:ABC-type phosphate transport system substrate-binding protein
LSSSISTRRARTATVLAAAACLAVTAPAASASTNLPPCGGSSVAGQGSSFQKAAHAAWSARLGEACGASPQITYTPNGSGAGLSAMGANPTGTRDATTRFAGTDDAPDAAAIAQINAGAANGSTGPGRIRTIPVAVGAIALIVNYPNGCTIPAASRHDDRFHLASGALERAWAGDTATWGALLPGIAETPAGGRTSGACAAQPVQRAVRFDGSGTTLQFKRWLEHVNPARGWSALANTAWPGSTVNAGVKGGGALADLVTATDGALGYVDLATARAKGFDKAPGTADDTFWLPVDDNTGSPTEPTADPAGYVQSATTPRGAGCNSTEFAGAPSGADPTLRDWSAVTGATTPTGYPLCALTFLLAWDDPAKVYGAGVTEAASARTVEDYLSVIVSAPGQAALAPGDYARLPGNLGLVAALAVAGIDFNR